MRRLLALAAPLVALLALPGAASAELFCVPGPCMGGTAKPTIQAAATAANSNVGTDVISIGPGTYNVGAGIQIDDPGAEVVGARVGQTIVTGDPFPLADPGTNRKLFEGGTISRLAGMTLRLPSAVTSGPSTWTGALIPNGLVENLRIDAVGATFGPGLNDGAGVALDLRAGTIRNVVVDIDPTADASGIQIGGTAGLPTHLENVEITAPRGLDSSPQAEPDPVTNTARDVEIHALQPLTVIDGRFELRDAILDASLAEGFGEFSAAAEVLDGRPPDPAGLTMDRVTLIGSGAAGTAALKVSGQGGSPPTFLTARHVAAEGFDKTLAWANFGSNPVATIDHSAVDLSAPEIANANPPGGALVANFGPGNRAGDPLFGNDLSPGLSSPAVDIGGPDLLPGGATDLRGNPRPADGNGDGTVLNDAGAIERQYVADGASAEILSRKAKLNRRGAGSVAVGCPSAAEQPPPCTVSLKIATAAKVRFKGGKRIVVLAKTKPVEIGAGATRKLKVRVRGRKLGLLRSTAKARKTVVSAAVSDGNDETGDVTAKLKLKPKRK
jgi:hypothetical protein